VEKANNSPQIKQFKAFQDIANRTLTNDQQQIVSTVENLPIQLEQEDSPSSGTSEMPVLQLTSRKRKKRLQQKARRKAKKKAAKKRSKKRGRIRKKQKGLYAPEIEELSAQLISLKTRVMDAVKELNSKGKKSEDAENIQTDDPIGMITMYKYFQPELQALEHQCEEVYNLYYTPLKSAGAKDEYLPLELAKIQLQELQQISRQFKKKLQEKLAPLGVDLEATMGLPEVLPDANTVKQSAQKGVDLPVKDESGSDRVFEDVAEDYAGPEVVHYGNRGEQEARETQTEHHVKLREGPWEHDQRREKLDQAWSMLPKRHVKFNPYLQSAHLQEVISKDEYGTSGLMTGTSINYFEQTTEASSKFAGTMVHETGHSVHSKSIFLLEELMRTGGWKPFTKASLVRELKKAGVPNFDAKIKEATEKKYSKTDTFVITRMDDTGKNFYLRPLGTVPLDETIGEQDRAEADMEFDYARTAPHELFAELYRMLFEKPDYVYQKLINEPLESYRQANEAYQTEKNPDNKRSVDQALLVKNSRMQQWNVMRNLVYGTGRAELALQVILSGAPKATKDAFNEQAQKVGTPSQLYQLPISQMLISIQEYLDEFQENERRKLLTMGLVKQFHTQALQKKNKGEVEDLAAPYVDAVGIKKRLVKQIIDLGGSKEVQNNFILDSSDVLDLGEIEPIFNRLTQQLQVAKTKTDARSKMLIYQVPEGEVYTFFQEISNFDNSGSINAELDKVLKRHETAHQIRLEYAKLKHKVCETKLEQFDIRPEAFAEMAMDKETLSLIRGKILALEKQEDEDDWE
jgi:hypothetical protein